MMKSFLKTIVFLIIIGCESIEIDDYEGEADISIMSFNLRYDEPEDGENQWGNRKEACVSMLKELQPSIFGIQEGLHNQVNYLNNSLSNYEYVGVGRDDGHSSGEYAAIFYNSDDIELIDNGNFWLSETTDIPSLGWDANNIRICSWARFRDIKNEKILYVFNTHFDHLGKVSQSESGKLLVEKISEIADSGAPIFITGDFNMLIGNSRISPLRESYFSAQRFAKRSDNNKSFNAFGRWYLNRNIDFIFYKNTTAESYKTIVKDYGIPFIYDHYPIISHFNYK